MKELIVITTPYFYPDEASLLTLLFEEGMMRLHLRKPGCDPTGLESLLNQIPSAYYSRIVLHDCFGLALERGLGGIHLNRRNPVAPPDYRGSISRSCHTLDEVNQYKPSCDYVFLSPIFQSISKEGYGSGFPIEELRQAGRLGQIDRQVIALGGISAQAIAKIKEIPFGGYAVLGDIWGSDPSLLRADHITQHFKELQTWL